MSVGYYRMRKERRVTTLSNGALIIEHAKCHVWAEDNYKDKPADWSVKEIEQRHDLIVAELSRRGIMLDPHSDLKEGAKCFDMYII